MPQGLFKKREPRKFNYKARYYDQQNAEIRKQKILNGEENTDVNFEDRFRQKVEENRKIKNNSIRKLVVMVTLLIILIYLIVAL
jgi:hypothetical protein